MLSEKHRSDIHLNNDISQKMRELARLVVVLRNESTNCTNLQKALVLENFNLIIKCVRKLTNLDNA